ncbi:hepB domain protein [Burkholderia pseudomallei]|nr:hepB domain protein [Burkholderia pseudomallei]
MPAIRARAHFDNTVIARRVAEVYEEAIRAAV